MGAAELTAEDWAGLTAAAEPVDPRRPERRIEVPRNSRSFLFELDNDLTKLVRLDPDRRLLHVTVLYFTDVVLEEERATILLDQQPTLTADAIGITVEWRQPLLASLGWPLIRRKRRF